MDNRMRSGIRPRSLTYPLLSPGEIVKFLADLRINMTLEELAKPTAARMVGIYDVFLEILMGTKREDLLQPAELDLQFAEYPELHKDSTELLYHYMQLRKFMTEIGMEDFSLADILKPDSGRIIKCLSAVINFTKFREQRVAALEVFTDKAEELLAQKLQNEQRNSELTSFIEDIRLEIEGHEKDCREIRKRNESLTEDINDLRKTHTVLSSDVEKLTVDVTSLENKLAQTKSFVDNLRKTCNKLALCIVKSPERLKNTLNEMESSLKVETARLLTLEQRSFNLQSTYNVLNEKIKTFVSCIAAVNICLSDYSESRKLEHEIELTFSSINETEAQCKKLEFALSESRKRYDHAELKIRRLDEHRISREKIGDRTLANLKAEANNLDSEISAAYNNARKSESDISKKKEKLIELGREEMQINKDLELILTNIIKCFRDYKILIYTEMGIQNLETPESMMIP